MKQKESMSSFLTEAKGMLDSLMQFSGCELYHHHARPMLEGLRGVLNTLDYDNIVGCLEKQIDLLLEEEGIAEAELNAFGLPDPELWPEDSVLPEDRDMLFESVELAPNLCPLDGIVGEEFNCHDLEYKIADKLHWLDMPVGVAGPAIDVIIKTNNEHYRRNLIDENISSDDLFGLLLQEDVPSDDYKMFISLRTEIERKMRLGADYKSAIQEWFK